MITDIQLPRVAKNSKGKKKGAINASVSAYNPPKDVRDRTGEIIKKFAYSKQIMIKPYREFNDKSLIDIQDECQKIFNNWRDAKSDDPDESWKSQAIRPIARNRAISIAAHLTGRIIEPTIDAQNEEQDSDKGAGIVLEKLLKWANDQAEYVKTFVYVIVAALVNPVVIIHSEYCKKFRTIKELDEKGNIQKKVVLDEDMSGFKDTIVPADELYIADAYEHEIQRQPYLIWRRAIGYDVAKQKYADNENFSKYVRPGLQLIFDSESGSFYEQFDESLTDNLVEEIIYYDRFEDLQISMVNGVMLSDVDAPIKRKDKKYPFVKGGYELIDEGKFFYFFSLVRKMKDDYEVINTLYRMIIDGSYLQLMPPTAIFGDEVVNASVVTPGTVNTFSENTKFEKIDVGGNMNAGLAALGVVEKSLAESSQDVLQQGLNESGSQTAFEISRREENAKIMLGLFGRMIADLVKDWGELRLGDIIQFMSVGEVQEVAGETSLKYRSFLVEEGGEKKSKIAFQPPVMMEQPMPKYGMLAMAGGAKREELNNISPDAMSDYVKKGYNSKIDLYFANPEIIRNLKYKVIVRADMVTSPSKTLEKAFNLEEYDRAMANPHADQEALYRDLLLGSYEKTSGNPDKYIKKVMPVQEGMMGEDGQGKPPSVLNKLFGKGVQGKNNQLSERLKTT